MVPDSDLVMVAARFHRDGALAEAEPLYRRALEDSPDDADLWVLQGQVCRGLGRHDEALGLYQGGLEPAQRAIERALALQPDLPEAHNNLGLAHLNQGRAEEARQCFTQALRLRPDMADAQNNLGLACAGLGWPDEAVACHE